MEFKLNKTHRLIANAAVKEESRPVLHCVHIREGIIEAANGFILMQRKLDYTGDSMLLDIKDIAKHKDIEALGGVVYTDKDEQIQAFGQETTLIRQVQGDFPKTEYLHPEGIKKPVFQIALGRSQLLNMLKCLDKNEEIIKFSFYGKESPAKIEASNGDVTGLIMPMHTGWDDKES